MTVIKRLEDLMAKDKKIVVLTGDLGFSVLDKIRERFPTRFYNVGISEQAMVGIAAGLAKEGKKVVVYSIIPFLLYRPFEQILVDVCYHNLPVVFIGSAEGFAYGSEGFTHYALNDLALMLQIPNMHVYSPAEPDEAASYLEEALSSTSPTYLRLSKGKNEKFRFIEKAERGVTVLRSSGMAAVLSTGGMSFLVEDAVSKLADEGFMLSHLHIGSLRPLSSVVLMRYVAGTDLIITIEEHNKMFGFGKFIESFLPKKPEIIGVENIFERNVGDRSYILKNQKLDSYSIYRRIKELL